MKNWTINTLLLLLFWLHSLCYKGTKTPVSHAALSPTRLWRSTYGQIFTTTKKTQLTQQCKQQKVIRIKCEPCKNIYRLYFTRRDCSLPKGLGKLLPSEPPAAAWPDLYVASAKAWMQDSVVAHFCCFEDIQQHYFLSFQLCFLFFFPVILFYTTLCCSAQCCWSKCWSWLLKSSQGSCGFKTRAEFVATSSQTLPQLNGKRRTLQHQKAMHCSKRSWSAPCSVHLQMPLWEQSA